MKKIIRAAVLGGATVAALAVPAAALASTNPVSPGNSGITKITAQHPAVYTDGYLGPVSCVEVAHNNGAGLFDSINCQSTTGSPLANVTPGETQTLPYQWISDFTAGPTTGLETPAPLTITVSADGMSYTATAHYGS